MSRRATGLLLALVLIFPAQWVAGGEQAAAAAGVPEFVAEYELRRNSTRAARLVRTLRCDEGECRFESEGKTLGLLDLLLRGRITEWTSFSINGDGAIRAGEYYYRQRARGGNNEYARLFFNAETGRVSSRGDEQWDRDVSGEAMDELLSQLRLMLAVRDGETSIEITVVDSDGELDEYRFEVVGEESVETPAGAFDAIRVERKGGSRRRVTTMWFAPSIGYVPIIVRQERVGRETYTVTLTELREGP